MSNNNKGTAFLPLLILISQLLCLDTFYFDPPEKTFYFVTSQNTVKATDILPYQQFKLNNTFLRF